MTEPVEFTLLNLDPASLTEFSVPIAALQGEEKDILRSFYFDLSQTIKVESRHVTTIPVLFGDIGGLYEFFATVAVSLIGAYKAKMFVLHQVNSLFRSASGSSKGIVP